MCCPPYGLVRKDEPGSDDYIDYYADESGQSEDHCTAPYIFQRNVTGPFLDVYAEVIKQDDVNFCKVKKSGNVCVPKAECTSSDQC